MPENFEQPNKEDVGTLPEQLVGTETALSPEQQKAKDEMINALREGNPNTPRHIKEKFNFSDEIIQSSDVQSAAKEGIVQQLLNDNLAGAVLVKIDFNVSAEINLIPEIQSAAKEGFLKGLKDQFKIGDVLLVKKYFGLPESLIESEEVQAAIKSAMVNALPYNNYEKMQNFATTLSVPVESIGEAVNLRAESILNGSANDVGLLMALQTDYPIFQEKIAETAQNKMLDILSGVNRASIKKFKAIKNAILPSVSGKLLESHIFQQAVRERVKILVSNNDFDLASEILDAIGIEKKTLSDFATGHFLELLSQKDFSLAFSLENIFPLTYEILNAQNAHVIAYENLATLLRSGKDINYINKIRDIFNLGNKIFESEALQQAIIEGFKLQLSAGKFDAAFEFFDELPLPRKLLNYLPSIRDSVIVGIKQKLVDSSPDNFTDLTGIKERFALSEEVFTETLISSMISLLSKGERTDNAIAIKERFNLPEEIIAAAGVQEAARDGVINILSNGDNISNAILIKEKFNLSEEAIAAIEVQEAAKRGVSKILDNGDVLLDVIAIKEHFNLQEDFIQEAGKICLIKRLHYDAVSSNGYRLELIKVLNLSEETVKLAVNEFCSNSSNKFILGVILTWDKEFIRFVSADELESIYRNAIQKLDKNIQNWFFFIEPKIGVQRLKNILIGKNEFWKNPHDNLLFVERILEQPEEKQEKIIGLIVPLLSAETDFQSLNEHLGYFDVDLYAEKNNGNLPAFASYEAFAREANLQRFNIKIPEDAPENFKNAVEILIQTKGVDVPFIRTLCDVYEREKSVNENLEPEDKRRDRNDDEAGEAFAQHLIDILEGKDDIDERKLIKPFESSISIDPINRLAYNAVGFHGLNRLTPAFFEHSQNPNGLGAVLKLLQIRDQEVAARLSAEKDALIGKNPQDKNRYIAEYDKRLKRSTLIRKGDADRVSGIALENMSDLQYLLSAEEADIVKQGLSVALYEETESPPDSKIANFRHSLIDALLTLEEKSDQLDNVFDLVKFRELIPVAQELKKLTENIEKDIIKGNPEMKTGEIKQKMKGLIDPGELQKIFQGQEVEVALFALYLGLKNRVRAGESLGFKKEVDQILNQKKYQENVKKLKADGVLPNNSNPFLAYINGQITLEPTDEESVKAILGKYGFADLGRKLTVEIAAGSDYTAWTCGDQTNCCMPFTSEKNREYLLRDDMSYFLVRQDEENPGVDIIAQSVLVAAKEPNDGTDVAAIDNIEIANRAIKYTPYIAQAYEILKQEIARRFAEEEKKPVKIVIGTSYNDEGGSVVGSCELLPRTADPIKGEMVYSDWHSHSSNYLLYDSEKRQDDRIKYFGLQIDMLDRSLIRGMIEREQLQSIEMLLRKIGTGEDDGDGGLIFPDNYSCVMVDQGKPVGFIIGADYISGEDDLDNVYIEKIGFKEEVSAQDRSDVLKDYFSKKGFANNEDIDKLVFRGDALQSKAEIRQALVEVFGKQIEINEEGGIMEVNFAKDSVLV